MLWTKSLLANLAVSGAAITAVAFQAAPESKPDVSAPLRHSVATKVIILKAESQRGEPKILTGSTRFDRNIESCWISVVGSDIKFKGSMEKQINRQFFEVDPFPKVINGKDVEITGKLGLRDGSGNWDDTHEGTITVAVTAILADR